MKETYNRGRTYRGGKTLNDKGYRQPQVAGGSASFFESSEQPVAAGTNVAHGLGRTPRMLRAVFRCVVDDNSGPVAGEEFDIANAVGLDNTTSFSVFANDTEIHVFGDPSNIVTFIPSNTNRPIGSLDNFRIVAYAIA